MNRNYRIVFNRTRGVYQVVSEHAGSSCKGSTAGVVVRTAGLAIALLVLSPIAAHALDINTDVTYIGPGVVDLGTDTLHVGVTAPGSVTIKDAGAITTLGSFFLGDGQTAALTIENGGHANSGAGYIGRSADTTVTVTGANSNWTSYSQIYVGFFGTGVLNVEDGGTVSSRNTYIGTSAGGTLNLNGTVGARGVLVTGNIRKDAGGAAFNFDGGVLRATGNEANFIQNFASSDIDIQAGGAFIDSNGFDIGVSTNLDGVGGLTKQGAGTLTLTGTNIYSGGTTVEAGTLQIGNGSTSGSILGNVTNNSALLFNRSDAQTYAGIISGTGSFTKLGDGTLTLSGKSTYSGTTTVSAGTLQAGVDDAIDSSSALTVESGATFALNNFAQTIGSLAGGGNVTLGSAFLTVGEDNSNTTFSGSISGAGGTSGLNKAGSGTQTLSGLSNVGISFVIVNGGTLQISDGGSLKNADSTIGYASSKVGTVIVTGAGSSWTNGSFYVGSNGTGTLNIENGGLISSSDGHIANGSVSHGKATVSGTGSSWKISGDLEVGRRGNGTLIVENGGSVSTNIASIGEIAGGSGTLNLNGTTGARGILTASYIKRGAGSAVFSFDGGILQARSNQSNFIRSLAAGSIAVNGGGAFIDTQAFDVGITTGGLFTGTGGLTKQGSGTLSIAGSNSYDGNTTIEAGTLRFDSYAQSASQTLGISASSNSSYGKLAVTNTATFDADAKISVDVTGINTLARGHLLTSVISAGTLTSTSFDVSDNSALLNFDAIRSGNAVDLRVATNSTTGIREAVIKSGATATLGAADVLDNTLNNGTTGDMANVVTALGKLATDSEVSQAATQTLPLLSSGVMEVTKETLRSINRLLQNHRVGTSSGLSGGDALANRAAWFKPFGSRAEQDDRDGASGFDVTTWGMAGGLEADLNRSTRIGIAYAYANSNVDGNTTLSGTQQHVDIDAHVLALYGTKEMTNDMSWGWQADVGQNSNSGTRHINFGGLDRTATADYKSYTAHIGMSLKKTLMLNDATSFTPTIRADYTRLHDQSYREQGADALNLNVDSHDTSEFVIGADARISHALTDHSHIEVYAGAGYDTINQRGNVVATYAGSAGQSFSTQGVEHSPWLLTAGLAYTHAMTSGTEITLRYDLDGRSDYLNQSASVKAKWLF